MIKTGATPSTFDPLDRVYAFERSDLYVGSAMPAKESVDLTDLHTWRVQGAESCVSYATAEMAQALAVAQGQPLELLSAACLYARARILGSPPIPGVGIPDGGSNCRLNLKVGRDDGLIAEVDYPDVPENIMRVPPASAWEAEPVAKLGACRRIHGEFDVTALRNGIVASLKLARQGLCSPPSGVMPVDQAYVSLAENDVYSVQGGNVLGTHAQIILSYDAARDAAAFGSSWGGERRFWVSLEWLSRFGFEFWLIENIIRTSRLAA